MNGAASESSSPKVNPTPLAERSRSHTLTGSAPSGDCDGMMVTRVRRPTRGAERLSNARRAYVSERSVLVISSKSSAVSCIAYSSGGSGSDTSRFPGSLRLIHQGVGALQASLDILVGLRHSDPL